MPMYIVSSMICTKKGALGKIYHGLVYHAPPEAEGVVDRPIGRCPKPSLLRQIDMEENRPEPGTGF